MICLVCKTKFDTTPAEASAEDLAHAADPAAKEALHVHARRKRAAEQSKWQHVEVRLAGASILSEHVCPTHANTESILKLVAGAPALEAVVSK